MHKSTDNNLTCSQPDPLLHPVYIVVLYSMVELQRVSRLGVFEVLLLLGVYYY